MAEDARAAGERLLYDYGAIADAKDLPAALALFTHATVTFPQRSMRGEVELSDFYGALWGKPHGHRHLITNVRVSEVEQGYSAKALYTRWEFAPEPLLTTMGEYDMHFSLRDGAWTVDALVVTRTWQVG